MGQEGSATYALVERLALPYEHDVALDEIGIQRLCDGEEYITVMQSS